ARQDSPSGRGPPGPAPSSAATSLDAGRPGSGPCRHRLLVARPGRGRVTEKRERLLTGPELKRPTGRDHDHVAWPHRAGRMLPGLAAGRAAPDQAGAGQVPDLFDAALAD